MKTFSRKIENPVQTAFKRQPLMMISAALIVLILIAFEPLRHNDFVNFDDPLYVTENPFIQDGFTIQSVKWAFTSGYASNWHPLTWLSHMMDIELFGFKPTGHHLHNLFLHILSTILLFWILHKMTGNLWCSAFAAIVFGIHPLRVESVAWAAERKDVLSMLFFALTLIGYFYYTDKGGVLRYLLVLLCFTLGLMAKPMLVTLPIVLLLLDYWPLARLQRGWKRIISEKIPLCIPAIGSCIITYLVQKSGGSINSFSFFSRFVNALISYTAYLSKIFWPHDLAVLYPYPAAAYPLWQTGIALVILLGISVFVVRNRSKHPFLLTGWLWYIITVIPVIGLVKVGNQAMADRYTYLPSIGIAIMAIWSAARFLAVSHYKKVVSGILMSMTIIALIIVTRRQTVLWKDSITLFEHTLAVTQDNAVIHNNITWPLWKQGKQDQAYEHLKKAIQISPDYPHANIGMAFVLSARKQYNQAANYLVKVLKDNPKNVEANVYMARILIDQDRFDEAQEYLSKALTTDTANADIYYYMGIILEKQKKTDLAMDAYRKAVKYNHKHFQAMNNLGVLLSEQALMNEAADSFRQSVTINPDYGPGWFNLGSILQKQGKFKEAIFSYREALKTDPNNIDIWSNLAFSEQSTGQLSRAVDSYNNALEIDPGSMSVMNNLIWILAAASDAQIRNPAKAMHLADKIPPQTYAGNPDILDTMAAAYASAGQFTKAVEFAQKAMESADAAGQKEKAGDIHRRLLLYQNGKYYIDLLLSQQSQ